MRNQSAFNMIIWVSFSLIRSFKFQFSLENSTLKSLVKKKMCHSFGFGRLDKV